MEYYAHSKDDGDFQLLRDHLEGVAERTRRNAEVFGAGRLGYLSGLLHDVGKYSEPFQARIRGSKIRVDHSTAGAKWIIDKSSYSSHIGTGGTARYLAELVSMVIAGHHGGLLDYGTKDEDGSYQRRVSKGDSEIPHWEAAWNELQVAEGKAEIPAFMQAPGLLSNKHVLAWKYSFLGRMLYSCLVDADSVDTRNFTSDEDRRITESREQATIPQLLERLDDYLLSFRQTEQSGINLDRKHIQVACRRQAESDRGLFSLSVPTGGGKTLSSMVFALEHAKKHKLRRVIYVIPFTSIIEQNARVFRKALGDDAVLEHHSNFNLDEYEENHDHHKARQLKLSTENWDSPVVVTTSVQFFESIFSNKRSKCRKLHQIAGSVIVIDEAQSLPRGYLSPCLQALQELTDHYNCSAVLCTATQPSWDKLGYGVKEIMNQPSPDELLTRFKRVQVKVHGANDEVVSDDTVLEWIAESEQVLCIVNTRKHARTLYDRLYGMEGIYHLSGRMCAAHRMAVLNEIRDRLHDGLPCRVISTQLIEAGVDVDFPKVFRAMAGLDSIAQAAGRCNREGKLKFGEVRVFYPERHGMPSKGWMKETAIEAQHVLYYEKDALSRSAIQNYFDRVHGFNDGTSGQKTDDKEIMQLLRDKNLNLQIPFEEIANRFKFIDGKMQSIVVPYDNKAIEIIDQIKHNAYPLSVMRKLQPYTVQVYTFELTAMLQSELLINNGGILCLSEPAYYSGEVGLLQSGETVEHEVLLF